ncbi:hypothetical protein LXL04_007882 [Taraxacum kok-saghyz]
MAQHRQPGGIFFDKLRNDQVSVGIRAAPAPHYKQSRTSHYRRFRSRRVSVSGFVLVTLTLIFLISASAFFLLSKDDKDADKDEYIVEGDEFGSDVDFLANVTRTERSKMVKFGHGNGFVGHGGDSRYWDHDDRRRDNDYGEDLVSNNDSNHIASKTYNNQKKKKKRAGGLYNEAGRNELKMYEAEYEASLKGVSVVSKKTITDEDTDTDDEYIDEIDMHDIRLEDYKDDVVAVEAEKQSSRRAISERKIASKKRSKRRKYSGACEMKVVNSSMNALEPPESSKFVRFSLRYKEDINSKFGGDQSLEERERSFVADDQTLSCGFVKGTGFDLSEDDAAYIATCHIAVISCIFGNSDRLRSPMGKTVSRFSRKNVCFVMFVDDVTLHTLSSEGHMPDRMGYIGIWRIVVVKNLPYTDMRRVGKIPKLLAHRLFHNARYSIWLDSKLRLQVDPIVVLEYFLWRKGHEYAISNHYDRHCVWEEVAQNKKLNKYNHTIIDQQFAFYQADGLTRFNPSDPQKLLPSNVPEGSFIVRAHTPMSNLFSCLWFNEVERFTPRDQLSFAYTYHKLTRINPTKPFYFTMFKVTSYFISPIVFIAILDCERRKVAKLFRHRSEESRYMIGQETE